MFVATMTGLRTTSTKAVDNSIDKDWRKEQSFRKSCTHILDDILHALPQNYIGVMHSVKRENKIDLFTTPKYFPVNYSFGSEAEHAPTLWPAHLCSRLSTSSDHFVQSL